MLDFPLINQGGLKMKRILYVFLLTSFLGLESYANSSIARSTKEALTYMRSIYGNFYAPASWKQEFDNLDIELEYQNIIETKEQKL